MRTWKQGLASLGASFPLWKERKVEKLWFPREKGTKLGRRQGIESEILKGS